MSATLMLVFLATLVIGVPIAFTMLVAGLAAVWVQGQLPMLVAVQQMFAGLDSFPLMAIPFFILAAELMTGGALTEVLLRFASQLIGHVRGGLGHTNVLTLTFFSGISGSALADVAGPGAMLIKMMRQASPGGVLTGTGQRMYQEMMDEELGKAIAKGGGLGLADMLVRDVLRRQGVQKNPSSAAAPVPTKAGGGKS